MLRYRFPRNFGNLYRKFKEYKHGNLATKNITIE